MIAVSINEDHVSSEIQGFDKLQKQLREAGKAFKEIDGEIAAVQFNPADHSSVEAAIADMERSLDTRLASYAGNPLVENVAQQMKVNYRERLLQRASEMRDQAVSSQVVSNALDQGLLRQIDNTVADLRYADASGFTRHIKKLSRLLHSPTLDAISGELIASVDVDAMLEAGRRTEGSMIGSASLQWPADTNKELGFVITMIDRFAAGEDEREGWNFAHMFYYNSNSIVNNLQNMVGQMIVPFARDYIALVQSRTGTQEAAAILPVLPQSAVRKAFVVHGHDEGSREAIARFLERINFEAVILHEQANQGLTIIEKIERHGEVPFAVILLTPDDFGAAQGGVAQPRARQNVVLELGYFIGKLSRSRVCALRKGEVEIPSDFAGVVYTHYDEGGAWKTALATELEAAGFDIDWKLVHKR